MSLPSVYSHPIHGASAHPLCETASPQSLLSACGRLVALCSPGAQSVDLFDAGDVAELSSVLGPGRCKLRFLASFPVADIADAVAVHALAFLRGGALALAGTCARGAGACVAAVAGAHPPPHP